MRGCVAIQSKIHTAVASRVGAEGEVSASSVIFKASLHRLKIHQHCLHCCLAAHLMSAMLLIACNKHTGWRQCDGGNSGGDANKMVRAKW